MIDTATAPSSIPVLPDAGQPPALPGDSSFVGPVSERHLAIQASLDRPLTADALRDMLANRKQRHDGWTPIKVAAFIEALAETCSVKRAAEYVNMSPAAAYKLRHHPDAAAFREAWDSAMSPAHEELKDIAMERIRNGVERIRWWHDQEVGRDIIHSERLLIHMLNRTDPDRIAARRAKAEAEPAPAVLPLAADFMVAAATETGKLGWDPDDDEIEGDDEVTEAFVAARRERAAADEAEYLALRERADAIPKISPERAFEVRLMNAERRVAAGERSEDELDDMLRDEAAADADLADLKRVLTYSTLGRAPQPRKSRKAASVSSGASSGRKCPPGTPRPRTSGA